MRAVTPVLVTIAALSGCSGGFEYDETPIAPKTLHRLNQVELDNTVRDLLATTFAPSSTTPSDEVTFGFDNMAQALTTSAAHLTGYEQSADQMLDEMMGRLTEETIEYPPVRFDDPGVTYLGTGIQGNAGYIIEEGELASTAIVDYDGQFEIRGTVFGRVDQEIPVVGLYVDGQRVFSTEVDAAPSSPVTLTHQMYLDVGLHRISWRLENPAGEDAPGNHRLGVQSFQLEGPLDPVNGPTEAYARVVTCDPAQAGESACAEEVLRNFLYQAWRRPPVDDDVSWAMGVYDTGVSEGEPWDRAVQHALKAVLLDPAFAYRVELDPTDGAISRRLDGFEVASRLSYFLWSTMPDGDLFSAAEGGQLDATEGVLSQASRMLTSERSGALIDNLAGQWWNLRRLQTARPNAEVYPEFDEELRASMTGELRLLADDFFAGRVDLPTLLVQQERWIDQRLAAHYGVDWPAGDEGWVFTTVEDPDRVGLLGAAAWLTTTSNATRPNPVRRGKWVLENLLCDSPPPPPPDVDGMGLEEPEETGETVREQEEATRAADQCQACHRDMDPIGFAMGGFDGTGVSRTVDELGFDLDTSALVEGNSFDGLTDIATWVAEDPRLPGCVVERAFTYAMGRPPVDADDAHIYLITDHFVRHGQTFPALVEAIVGSRPFLFRSTPPEGSTPADTTPGDEEVSR